MKKLTIEEVKELLSDKPRFFITNIKDSVLSGFYMDGDKYAFGDIFDMKLFGIKIDEGIYDTDIDDSSLELLAKEYGMEVKPIEQGLRLDKIMEVKFYNDDMKSSIIESLHKLNSKYSVHSKESEVKSYKVINYGFEDSDSVEVNEPFIRLMGYNETD